MIDALLADPFAQGIGFVATLGGMTWALFRTRASILLVQLFTGLCFTAHFALLGANTGAVMNLLASLQVLAAIPLGARPGFRYVYLAILPLIAGGLVATWHGPASAFAALGLTFVSLARYQTDVLRLRLFMAVALPCWFGHNFMVASVPAMMSDIVGMALNTVMLARLVSARRAVAEGTP